MDPDIELQEYRRLEREGKLSPSHDDYLKLFEREAAREKKWRQRFLDLAKFVAGWSKDPSTQVGAVIVDPERRIVSTGYNGFARGVVDSSERLNDRETKYKLVVHAERNAIIFARQDLRGCTLYTYPFMPCAPCAGMVVQAGICEVVAPKNDNPRWQEDFKLSRAIFSEAGLVLREVEPEHETICKAPGTGCAGGCW